MSDINRIRRLAGILTESTDTEPVDTIKGPFRTITGNQLYYDLNEHVFRDSIGVATSWDAGIHLLEAEDEEWLQSFLKGTHYAQPHQTRVKRDPYKPFQRAKPETVEEPIALPGEKHADLKSRMAQLDELIGIKQEIEKLQTRAEKWGPLPADVRFQLDDSHFSTRDIEGKLEKNRSALQALKDYLSLKKNLYSKRSKPMYESAPPGMEDLVQDLKTQYPGHPERAFATAWSVYNKKHGLDESETAYAMDDDFSDELDGGRDLMDVADDLYHDAINAGQSHPEALKAASDRLQRDYGMGSTEARNLAQSVATVTEDQNLKDLYRSLGMDDDDDESATEIEFTTGPVDGGGDTVDGVPIVGEGSLNNGYDDQNCACGDDYFPNGATGPVRRTAGPSGARHGDNPDIKAMEISETYKSLVRSYSQFLKG